MLSGWASRTKETVAVCELPSTSVPETLLSVNPAVSSSELTIVFVWFANGSKASSEDASILAVIVTVISPSTRSSSTDVRVTVCEIFQFALVKVKLVGLRVTSEASELVISITTLLSGWASRTKVKLAVAEFPSAKVPETEIGLTVKPGAIGFKVITLFDWAEAAALLAPSKIVVAELGVTVITSFPVIGLPFIGRTKSKEFPLLIMELGLLDVKFAALPFCVILRVKSEGRAGFKDVSVKIFSLNMTRIKVLSAEIVALVMNGAKRSFKVSRFALSVWLIAEVPAQLKIASGEVTGLTKTTSDPSATPFKSIIIWYFRGAALLSKGVPSSQYHPPLGSLKSEADESWLKPIQPFAVPELFAWFANI